MFNIIDPTNLYQDNKKKNNTASRPKRNTQNEIKEFWDYYELYEALRRKGVIKDEDIERLVEQRKKENLTPKSIREIYLAKKKEVERIESQTKNSSNEKLAINYKN